MQKIKSFWKASCFPPANMQMWPGLSGFIRKAAAGPARWPTVSISRSRPWPPYGSPCRGFLPSRWFALSSHAHMLVFWWLLCLGRKWWGKTWPDSCSHVIPWSFHHCAEEPASPPALHIPPDTLKAYCAGWNVTRSAQHAQGKRVCG